MDTEQIFWETLRTLDVRSMSVEAASIGTTGPVSLVALCKSCKPPIEILINK